MRTINNLLQSALKLNITDVALNAMATNEEGYKLLQKDQLLHGLRADGGLIGKYRSEAYANEKYAQNSLAGFGNVDLRLKGDFYSAIQVSTAADGFIIEDTDSKAAELEAKYGDPFGLEDSRKSSFTQVIQPEFVRGAEAVLNRR